MKTPAHVALSLAVLGSKSRRGDWWAISAGAILPDLLLFTGLALRTTGVAGLNTALVPVLNSAVVWGLTLVFALGVKIRWLALVAASALLHIALDLPLHNHDARPHFWPLSDAPIISPVSFWDADHHGVLFGTLEGLLFAICFTVIWRRLDKTLHRFVALAFAAVYVATFVHFAGHAFADAHWAIW